MSFFEKPLAYRMRPQTIEEFIGQKHLLDKDKPIKIVIENKNLPSSIIFWGPPGSGKTTLARLISKITNSEFIEFSAVNTGKKDLEKAINNSKLFNKKTIIFLDEIHRFNKAQQDFLLPYVENRTITLIGATTENPCFEIISPLLSRLKVFTLNQLNNKEIKSIILRALKKENGLNNKYTISEKALELITELSNGDARSALNILEISAFLSKQNNITKEIIQSSAQRTLRYDKNSEEHYNIISALIKSMRDSDINASIYWTMRMIEAGEDPKYIIRRMIRFASEDIGNADPQALQLAISAKSAIEFLGYPECDTALIQTAIYLAKAPKSNSVYKSVLKTRKIINQTGNLSVPLHLRNANTNLMKELGYGKDYKYFHNNKTAKYQQHLPNEINNEKFYED